MALVCIADGDRGRCRFVMGLSICQTSVNVSTKPILEVVQAFRWCGFSVSKLAVFAVDKSFQKTLEKPGVSVKSQSEIDKRSQQL